MRSSALTGASRMRATPGARATEAATARAAAWRSSRIADLHEHVGRREVARRQRGGQGALALHRVRRVAEAAAEAEHQQRDEAAERRDREGGHGDAEHGPRPARDRGRDALPNARAARAGGPCAGGPEGALAEQRQDGGQERETGDGGDAGAQGLPGPIVRVEESEAAPSTSIAAATVSALEAIAPRVARVARASASPAGAVAHSSRKRAITSRQ